jgi:hypothetical protein
MFYCVSDISKYFLFFFDFFLNFLNYFLLMSGI